MRRQHKLTWEEFATIRDLIDASAYQYCSEYTSYAGGGIVAHVEIDGDVHDVGSMGEYQALCETPVQGLLFTLPSCENGGISYRPGSPF